MSDVRAYRLGDIPAPATANAVSAARRAEPAVAVEIAGAARLADVQVAWTDLLARADAPNVFMDPALVRVAAQTDPDAGHRALRRGSRSAASGSLSASGPSPPVTHAVPCCRFAC